MKPRKTKSNPYRNTRNRRPRPKAAPKRKRTPKSAASSVVAKKAGLPRGSKTVKWAIGIAAILLILLAVVIGALFYLTYRQMEEVTITFEPYPVNMRYPKRDA